MAAIMKRKHSFSCFPLVWLTQWVLWIAFADNCGIREIAVGGASSAAATLTVFFFRQCTDDRFELHFKHLSQIIHVPVIVLSDTWILLRVVGLGLIGREAPDKIVAVSFRMGGNDPASRGRRALAITYLTFTPNTLVLGLLPDEEVLFFHTVIPQPLPHFMFKMGATLDRKQAGT
jgi:multisubunit Na+/H+ antiporter MnhE subunit